jgi:ABC-type antimicrobial peptide transport system permease subunit
MSGNTPFSPPPRWADRLLERFCAPEKLEEVLGDLHERYHRRAGRLGVAHARRQYARDVLSYLRPSVLKRKPADHPKSQFTDMLRNYITIAWRNLAKNRAFSATNMGGLTVGMAVSMLIGLWVYDELTFNTYHAHYDRIARVYRQETWHGETGVGTSMQLPVGTELRSAYQGDFTRVVTSSWTQKHIIAAGDKKFTQTGNYMQPEGPELLTLQMRQGSRTGLRDPHSILLSESLAGKLFGREAPMGKMLKINNTMDVTVTGVYEDLPHNSEYKDMTFVAPWDLLLSNNEYLRSVQDNWDAQEVQILVQIPDNTTFGQVEAKIKDVILRHVSGKYAQAHPQLMLHPMSQWHLYSKFKNGATVTRVTSDALKYVRFYSLIGVFVLLLACINFMNMSTARAHQRAREVGVRKAIGSSRTQLIGQFLSESLLFAAFAFGLSILLVQLTLPWFNQVADRTISILWTNPWFWLAGLGFTLLTGLLAGSYPALYLSSFDAVRILKGTFQAGRSALAPRRVLVVVQFTVCITLIIGTVIVYRQIIHTKNRPVGYTRDGLLMLQKTSPNFYGKYEVFRNELRNTGAVYEIAESASPVTGLWHTNNGFDWKGKDPALEESLATVSITPEYGKTVGWQFVAGRDFSRKFASDSVGFVINETAVRYMGLKHPVGEIVRWSPGWRKAETFRILGVVKDMVTESPFEPVKPTVFYIQDDKNFINIRINPAVSTAEALPKIEAVFKQLIPEAPFDYKFVDQEYAAKFAAEERIGTLAGFFATLAIFISCLGLFGLASFTTEQRSKEIGIRKVLGASVVRLWQMLSKDFLILVFISGLISVPLTCYFMSSWLQNYQYRTTLSWWTFAATILGALVITLLTVSFQTFKAALMNPVKFLRNE